MPKVPKQVPSPAAMSEGSSPLSTDEIRVLARRFFVDEKVRPPTEEELV